MRKKIIKTQEQSLDRRTRILRSIAIIIAFLSTYIFFIKLVFL
jgi:hypothetical protein